MVSKKIENLIVKYLTNEANTSDLDFLSQWIDTPENQKAFETYVKTYYEVTLAMSKPDIDSLKSNLLKKMRKDKNPFNRSRLRLIQRYAALVIFLMGLAYLYKKYNAPNTPESIQKTLIIPKEEAVTLHMEDGTLITIDSSEERILRHKNKGIIGHQNKSQLSYTGLGNVEEPEYVTLNVPRGKRFDIILSDGTQIYLNSGTSIRYPVNFVDGKQRNVFLSGEAYFNVAEDKKNPFVVHVDQMGVKVLGTKFNISHYAENESINTVLVEGSVQIFDNLRNTGNIRPVVLKPGFKAEWDKSKNTVDSIENVDTRLYTAWIEGKLIFRNTSFKNIRNTLERHYNVTIKNNNKNLDVQLFDATFDIESINEILEAFNKSYAIEYKIINNEVIIN